tara:strand:- start:162 stop:323 length:162 start_codon:yes stop_codon:yes gene_type:complete
MAGKCPKGQKWSKEKGKCVLRKRTKKKIIKAVTKGMTSTLSQLGSEALGSLNK